MQGHGGPFFVIDRDQMLERWKQREGEVYTNRPDDRGGPTKFGLTLSTLRGFKKDPKLPASVLEQMAWSEAKEIVWQVFAVDTRFTLIDDPMLFEVIWDAAGNHGSSNATKMLQRSLMIPDDGIFGKMTVAALPWLNPTKLCLLFQCERQAFYSLIASRNKEDNDHDGIPDAMENLPGWINRATALTRRIAWTIK